MAKNLKWQVPLVALVALLGAMAWAKSRDPFRRIEFDVKAGAGSVKGVAVLPKSAAGKLPVLIFLHGSGGSLMRSGNELRQFAELGLAAVCIDYNRTNSPAALNELNALLDYLPRQPWADADHTAWVGHSLGAQTELAFLLEHPDRQPRLVVRLAGGWVPELGPKESPTNASLKSIHSQVLIVHGARDGTFPVQDARNLATLLQTNGIPVVTKIFEDEDHGFNQDWTGVIRLTGEYCQRVLDPEHPFNGVAPLHSHSIWTCLSPAMLLALFFAYLYWSKWPPRDDTQRLTGPEKLLRWVAAILAVLAIAQTSFHWLVPRFAVSDRTLAFARHGLVANQWRDDFESQATNEVWRGQRLKYLLDSAELANYNRALVNWKTPDPLYRDFVLSPVIEEASATGVTWRRELWENFYPRIRRETSPDEAAHTVVRFLRQRVTIASGPDLPRGILAAWQRGITDTRGFESLYVAALRSVGVAARLNASNHTEFWNGEKWQSAPRPLMETADEFEK